MTLPRAADDFTTIGRRREIPAPPLRLFAIPGFWTGAAAARAELLQRYGSEDDRLAYHAAIGAHEATAAQLAAGRELAEIPEFEAWRKTVYGKPRAAPDTLAISRPGSRPGQRPGDQASARP